MSTQTWSEDSSLDRQSNWFKPFPNQFHRLSHNFFFMTVDNNSLGVKSLEGLEKGNFTTQVMDAHHTYKGSRKRQMLVSSSISD